MAKSGNGHVRRRGTARDVATTLMIGLVAAWALIGLIASQVNLGVERELGRLEGTLSDAMRRLLESEARLLRGAFEGVDPAAPQDMRETLARLSESNQGPDQHLFVYHQDGTTLVSPGLTTAAQRPGLSEILRAGSGFHKALVRGPDGAPEAPMLIYIDAGNGAPLTLGVGRFSDAITDRLSEARAELEAEARRSVRLMGAAVAGILMALSWYWVARAGRERRLAEGKIRHLTERAVHAQEDERGRISRELHDTVGQRLITARHALDLARRRLEIGDPGVKEVLAKSADGLGGTLNEVRRISRDMRPGVMTGLGLDTALQGLADAFATRTGIRTDVDATPLALTLGQDAKLAFYRVAQEALSNIERHSGADRAIIRITERRRVAVLEISDNGQGISAAGKVPLPNTGIGLRNMAERVELLGGSFVVTSSSLGTSIEAEIPLQPASAPRGLSPRARA